MTKLCLQAGSSNFAELSLEAFDGEIIIRHSKFPTKPFSFRVPKSVEDGFSAIPLGRKTTNGLVKGPTVRIWPILESDLVQITLVDLPGYGDVTWFVIRSEFDAALADKGYQEQSLNISESQLLDQIDGVEE